ncbi:MAG: preprotein translocase subunit SecG [Magnetococcales bacterium]|nr:preprotein translocase subunit SecG [Magnetococcales bacterium]
MTLIITVVHILVSLSLIFIVLLQKGSGADMGSAFGGSSQSVFGARGSGSFLGKLTAGLATVFMLTSLSLAFVTAQKGANTSVMEKASSAARTAAEPVDPNASPMPAKESDTAPDAKGQPPATPAKAAEPVSRSTIPSLPSAEKGHETAIPSVPKAIPAVPKAMP